jgi:hypothetical protein
MDLLNSYKTPGAQGKVESPMAPGRISDLFTPTKTSFKGKSHAECIAMSQAFRGEELFKELGLFSAELFTDTAEVSNDFDELTVSKYGGHNHRVRDIKKLVTKFREDVNLTCSVNHVKVIEQSAKIVPRSFQLDKYSGVHKVEYYIIREKWAETLKSKWSLAELIIRNKVPTIMMPPEPDVFVYFDSEKPTQMAILRKYQEQVEQVVTYRYMVAETTTRLAFAIKEACTDTAYLLVKDLGNDVSRMMEVLEENASEGTSVRHYTTNYDRVTSITQKPKESVQSFTKEFLRLLGITNKLAESMGRTPMDDSLAADYYIRGINQDEFKAVVEDYNQGWQAGDVDVHGRPIKAKNLDYLIDRVNRITNDLKFASDKKGYEKLRKSQ